MNKNKAAVRWSEKEYPGDWIKKLYICISLNVGTEKNTKSVQLATMYAQDSFNQKIRKNWTKSVQKARLWKMSRLGWKVTIETDLKGN